MQCFNQHYITRIGNLHKLVFKKLIASLQEPDNLNKNIGLNKKILHK